MAPTSTLGARRSCCSSLARARSSSRSRRTGCCAAHRTRARAGICWWARAAGRGRGTGRGTCDSGCACSRSCIGDRENATPPLGPVRPRAVDESPAVRRHVPAAEHHIRGLVLGDEARFLCPLSQKNNARRRVTHVCSGTYLPVRRASRPRRGGFRCSPRVPRFPCPRIPLSSFGSRASCVSYGCRALVALIALAPLCACSAVPVDEAGREAETASVRDADKSVEITWTCFSIRGEDPGVESGVLQLHERPS
jgi:hypothetical protein